MKRIFYAEALVFTLIVTWIANDFQMFYQHPTLLWLCLPLVVAIVAVAGFFKRGIQSKRLRICYHGGCLLSMFAISLFLSLIWQFLMALFVFAGNWRMILYSVLFCAAILSYVFWNGILCVYLTSAQLGLRRRVLGILVGLIPPLNLIMLGKIIVTVFAEVRVETEKAKLNEARRELRVCATKYPVLLVHGLFFRDSRLFNYWGRIPAELKKNGARVFYGEHDSARPVAESAAELADRIEWILKKTGAEKVNVIAHSKGGLDMRYAISCLGVAPYVASLTTINTPHNGCIFANKLLKKTPEHLAHRIAHIYDTIAQKAGDEHPDFLAAVQDLTDEACIARNEKMPLPQGIFCQSIGSRLKRAGGGRFPLNVSYRVVKHYDGPNDGLVAESSFAFGESFTLLTVKGRRGISHADMVDMNRENLPEFDVREFYVQMVSDLRKKGF